MTSPEDFVKDWIEKSSRAQRGLVQHWQEDMNRNQELADVMRGIVQERSRPFKGERGRSKCQGMQLILVFGTHTRLRVPEPSSPAQSDCHL